MKQHKITLKNLAKESNISERTISEFLRGITKNPHIETIKPIITTLSDLTGENLGYLLTDENENKKQIFITKNKANIFDNEGKLIEIELSPNNVNKIIAMIKALEEEERKIKYKKNVTPIIIKPQGVPEEDLIPAVARSKDNAVKAVYLTKEEIEKIQASRIPDSEDDELL